MFYIDLSLNQDNEQFEETLIFRRKKVMSAVEGRGLVLVTVGLLFAIVLTSTPTLFHFWDFVTKANGDKQVRPADSK